MNDLDAIPYQERLEELLSILARRGSLGALLIDLTPISQTEHDYGSSIYESELDAVSDLILKLVGTQVRTGDLLATSETVRHAFLVFLSPQRTQQALRVSGLQAAAGRIEDYLNRSLAELPSSHMTKPLMVTVGSVIVLHNPLVAPQRLISRLVDEAWDSVRFQRLQRQFKKRSRLVEILLNREITTLHQPIVDIQTEAVLGYEALSRGPQGTAMESPLELFKVAAESGLTFELDRLCRRLALTSSRGLPPSAKVFINILPPTTYDPEFKAANVCRILSGLGLAPEQVIFELAGKLEMAHDSVLKKAIEDLGESGFSIAVDDIGVGHSLETIAHLHPRYIKPDLGLVREIHNDYVRRETLKAMKDLADKLECTIIAKGIERPEELETLLELGIEYGQGFLLGHPEPRFSESPAESEATQLQT